MSMTDAQWREILDPDDWAKYGVLPQMPQRQDALDDQLRDVARMANRMGCYDAADWIKRGMLR